MAKSKIDRVELHQMVKEGVPGTEIAEHFGVTPGAISKAKKELRIDVVKNVALESAHRVVDSSINAVEQLQKVNQNANALLDMCMAWGSGDEESAQMFEKWAKEKKVSMKDPRDLALRAMAEIRGQLKLQLELLNSMYDMKMVQEFQHEVLNTIGEINKDVRDEIIRRLQEKRALRLAIRFD
jgi:predicted transcriptional regulator